MTDRIKKLEYFLEINPADVFSMYGLALEYIKQQNYSKAVPLLEKSIQLDSNFIAAYYQLALVFLHINEFASFVQTQQRGIEVCQQLNDFKTLSEIQQLSYTD